MKFVWGLMFILISAQAQAAGWQARASYDYLESKNYTGSMLGAQAQYKMPQGSFFGGARKLSRQYTGAEINENAYDFGGAYDWFKGSYIEASTSQSPGSDILPLQTYSVAVHGLVGPADYGLGLSYSKYRLTEATTFRPFYMREFTGALRGGAEVFLVFSDRESTAGHLFGAYDFNDRHTFRADFAGGETLEDAGVHANFSSISGEYGYRRARWALYFSVTSYDSDIRRETGYGVRLELK